MYNKFLGSHGQWENNTLVSLNSFMLPNLYSRCISTIGYSMNVKLF